MTPSDPLSDVLALLRPQAYGFRGLDVGGAWSLHLPADEVVRCYALLSGACGLWLDGADTPLPLVAGDFVLLPHGNAVVLGSRADAPRIDLDAFLASGDGEITVVGGGGTFSGLGGYFELMPGPAPLLLGSLPPVVHLDAGADHAGLRWLVERLMGELRRPRPGGRLVAGHLCETLLIEAIRLYMQAGSPLGAGWLAALADARLSRAVAALHADPARSWTLAALARVAGMSRSSFAAAFSASIGEPAIAYLIRWRMHLAADRLGRGVAIGEVAHGLGYASESAFGAAFRRVTGTSPRRHAAGLNAQAPVAVGTGAS